MKEKKNYWLAAIVLFTLFIWANSFVPKAQSAELSGGLTSWVSTTFHWSITEHLIRKTAHFCEYGGLGLLYGLSFWRAARIRVQQSSAGQRVFNCAALGLMTAVIDESIQILSGRGPLVSDILLDFAGFMTGFVVCQLVLLIFGRRKS